MSQARETHGFAPGKVNWIPCGQQTVLDPLTKKPIALEVVEQKGYGRIFAVMDIADGLNMDFILTACNSHDEMLAALKDVLQRMNRYGSGDVVFKSKLIAIVAKAEGRGA